MNAAKLRIKQFLRETSGSMIPLSIFFFLVTLMLTFTLINVTHYYIERRHLILVVESALQSASQNLDEKSYYLGINSKNRYSVPSGNERLLLPIDCAKASEEFPKKFRQNWLLDQNLNPGKGEPRLPLITHLSCEGVSLRSTVKARVSLPFPVTFAGVDFFEFMDQSVTVFVGSVVGG